MSTLVLYKTKWGSTRQYAEWIAEATQGCELYDIDKFDLSNINKYDKVVIGGRTYMGQISVVKYLVQNWGMLSTKPVFLFTVGLVSWDKPDSQKAYDAIPGNIRQALVSHVKLPGKIDWDKITWLDKLVVRMMYGAPGSIDKMDRNAIQPIIEFINNYT